MTGEITYKTNLIGVDWEQIKATLAADHFDNGRSREQLRKSFENSYAAVVACDGENIISTARVLSDGVCNAYVVDVWTLSTYRKRGVKRRMMEMLEANLEGQQHLAVLRRERKGDYPTKEPSA